MIRFRFGEGGGETIVCEMRETVIIMSRNLFIGTAAELRTNKINTNGNNSLVFERDVTAK